MSTIGREAATAQQAQIPGITRIDLQRQDLSAPGREVIQNRVEISDEAPLIRHKHPGEEIIYVLDGVAACFGGEGFAEVAVERAALEAAGLVDGVLTAFRTDRREPAQELRAGQRAELGA